MTLPPPSEAPSLPRAARSLVEHAVGRWRTEHAATASPSARRIIEAIEAGRLGVAYQPILQLSDRRLVAFEALVRMPHHGDEALADAASVIAVAERDGAIHALGTSVLVAACAQLAVWRRRAVWSDVQMHVNISPLQLRDEHIVPTLEQALQATGLTTDAVVLEVTETAAFDPDGVAEATLSRLDGLGVEIAIDDFGTGFASLDLLAATPARSIKLDRSFVSSVGEMSAAPRGRALVVQAAIGLGRALGMRVVAEGIESPSQARTLEAWGCVFGQGYLFAKPLPADEVELEPAQPARPASASRPQAGAPLAQEAIELALAVATMVVAGGTNDLPLRADAQHAALVIGEALGADRARIDVAAVLASIADAPQRFGDILSPRSSVAPVIALTRELMAPASLQPDATAGMIAAAAHLLAIARDADTEADLPATLDRLGTAGNEVLRDRLTRWWETERAPTDPGAQLRTLESRLRRRDDASRRLRSLSALTRAVSGGGSLVDVLEVTAEEARTALGAASVAISRIERHRGHLRTLVNVGELAPWEQRRPTDETYPLSDYPDGAQHLFDRAIQVVTVDPGGTPEERLLVELAKGSAATVPIVVDGTTWGEVYVTTHVDAPPFTASDAPFLRAVANVIALAIGRTEHVDELSRLADEDPLTRLPNRRALERYLADAGRSRDTTELGLLLLDVDGLSTINERFGHAAGDGALVAVGDVLNRVTVITPGTFAARLGGDEFCLAVTADSDDLEQVLELIRARLADGPEPRPTISAGYAKVRADRPDAIATLLRRADAAQYLATRTGAPLVAVGPDSDLPTGASIAAMERADDTGEVALIELPADDRAAAARTEDAARPLLVDGSDGADGPVASLSYVDVDDVPTGGATDAALHRWRDHLGAGLATRLEALGEAAVVLLDLNRYSLSFHPAGTDELRTLSLHIRRRRPNFAPFAPLEEEVYALSDFPLSEDAVRRGTAFAIDVDDAGADPTERALLEGFGHRYVIAVGAPDGAGGGYLLECYGDAESRSVAIAQPLIEALASRTLGRRISVL